jgi:hypothetical protein
MPGIKTGMADDLNGLEYPNQVKELLKAKLRDLADKNIGAARTEIPERAVQAYAASMLMKFRGNGAIEGPWNVIELFRFQPYFDVDPEFQDHMEIVRKKFPGHVDVHLRQKAGRGFIEVVQQVGGVRRQGIPSSSILNPSGDPDV